MLRKIKNYQKDDRVPTLSGKEATIFELLLENAAGEMYGLELVENSGGQLKRGTVYVTLSRMEEKGFVESRQEEPQPGAIGLPRRLYRPTGYGQRVYAAWQMARDARRLFLSVAGGGQ